MYESWEVLEEACQDCTKCALHQTRNKVVVGVGNRSADVLFVGEGPGEKEDEIGEPFVGRGGQLLDKLLAAVDLDRHANIYIANMVKCRPPDNRDPLQAEQDACIDYLRAQVKLIEPKVIVCLGRVAAQRLIKPDFRVTREHGEFFKKGDLVMMGTFHPAALLRNPNNKPDAFADFLKLQEYLKG